MPSSYPAGLDTMLAPAATLAGPEKHSDIEIRQNDAIAAVQGELGTDPAGSFATVAARLADIEAQLSGIGNPTWQSFNPTFQGITALVGSGEGRYIQINKLVLVMAFGEIQTVGNDFVHFVPPVTRVSNFANKEGFGWFTLDSGGTSYHAIGHFANTGSNITARRISGAGTSGAWSTSSNNPKTWTAGDEISFTGFYEAL